MEKLLNKLIEKGWKPRGIYTSLIGGYGLVRCEEYVGSPNNERKSYRELVSKESGLWQFVCENKMINLEYDITKSYKDSRDRVHHGGYNGDRYLEGFDMYNYKYRIIESALCNEEDLEKFLLDNIKI